MADGRRRFRLHFLLARNSTNELRSKFARQRKTRSGGFFFEEEEESQTATPGADESASREQQRPININNMRSRHTHEAIRVKVDLPLDYTVSFALHLRPFLQNFFYLIQ